MRARSDGIANSQPSVKVRALSATSPELSCMYRWCTALTAILGQIFQVLDVELGSLVSQEKGGGGTSIPEGLP